MNAQFKYPASLGASRQAD